MNPAQPKHAEIPEHGPSIRLRLEIELPLESPDLFRCLQAHRQSPRLLSVKSAPEVRVLPSAGITRHQRYYHPFRFPPAPPPEVTLRPLPSPATGLPRLPVSPSLRAVPTTPADRNGCIRRLLPHSTRPSPNLRRVGVHIFTFEACSGFTRVRPARSLNRPGRPLSQGFGPARLPDKTACQLPDQTDNCLGGSFLHWCYAPSGRTEKSGFNDFAISFRKILGRFNPCDIRGQ